MPSCGIVVRAARRVSARRVARYRFGDFFAVWRGLIRYRPKALSALRTRFWRLLSPKCSAISGMVLPALNMLAARAPWSYAHVLFSGLPGFVPCTGAAFFRLRRNRWTALLRVRLCFSCNKLISLSCSCVHFILSPLARRFRAERLWHKSHPVARRISNSLGNSGRDYLLVVESNRVEHVAIAGIRNDVVNQNAAGRFDQDSLRSDSVSSRDLD